ncbi:hypothetical protein OROMI_010035 [Orobanche minor]
MCSAMSTFSLCLPSRIPFLLRHRSNFSLPGNPLYFGPRNPNHILLSASVAQKRSSLEVSWILWDKTALDDYNGWAIEESSSEPVKKTGFCRLSVIRLGSSVVAVLGLLAYVSFSNRGYVFRLRSPFSTLHGFPAPSSAITHDIESEEVIHDVLFGDARVPDENVIDVSDSIVRTETSSNTMKEKKLERIIVPLAVDSAQQEALISLKTLKIIEDDVKADELCTRREYARWLVRANSQLERSRKHCINTSAVLSGSIITAFDDVGIEDPDFEYIQSLAEAGVIRSKLSDRNSSSNSNVGDQGCSKFFPERFISRQDLISWKAKIEYRVTPRVQEEMSLKKIGFLDVKEISSDALVELLVDILADEKSIIRGVFGQSKRLQPNKPCTKGQAAVALRSGRMTESIRAEISRLEAENLLRQNELNEIMSELLERGEITQYWERKTEEEKNRGLEVEIHYHSSISALEQEKTFQESASAEMRKQRAALDCQEKLLSGLKVEVTDMSEKLTFERDKYMEEQVGLRDMRNDLQLTMERLLDKKSILAAEVEALRILSDLGLRKRQEKAKLVRRFLKKLGEDGNGTANLNNTI